MNDLISSNDTQTSTQYKSLQLQEYNKKRLLLHCCCAPCASYVIKHLQATYDITLYFYNPNIEPPEEYSKRRNELKKLAEMYSLHYQQDIALLDEAYDNSGFMNLIGVYADEGEGSQRCSVCFDIRLGETARRAKELGFDYFTTTLSVSPHKNAVVLNDCGIRQSAEHNIAYLEADFKKSNGFMQSIELSKKYGLYRQNYCGCIYSLLERFNKNTSNRSNTQFDDVHDNEQNNQIGKVHINQ